MSAHRRRGGLRQDRDAPINELEILAGALEHVAMQVFVSSKEKERNESSNYPQFGGFGKFSFGLPAKNSPGNLERDGKAKD